MLGLLAGLGDPARMDDPDGFRRQILDAHNQVRASAPAARPLAALDWSPELAAEAQRVADRCEFRHSHGSHGENLYARARPTRPARVVDAWAGEADRYSLASNRCAPGAICGHYTQLVWGETREVGCAVAHCTANNPFEGWDAWTLWVCEYDPPGNWRGRTPF